MKKNFFIVKKLLVMFFVISHTYVCGMEEINKQLSFAPNDNQLLRNTYNKIIAHDSVSSYFSERKRDNKIYLKEFYQEESALASEYNCKNILLSLPNESLYSIFAYSVDTTKPLKDIMKSSLLLSTMCKAFNTPELLITIGRACSHYGNAEKNSVMKQLLRKANDINYWNRRNGAFLLTYAGADNNADGRYSLLSRAIHREDKQMIIALFQNNVSPNQWHQKEYQDPDFFDSSTIEIAQMFINQGVDLKMKGYFVPNILWACITHGRSSDLIEFYLNHNADSKKIDIDSNECILHHLINCDYNYRNIENYIHIAALLLKAAPDIINTLNKKGQTVMDITKKNMREKKQELNKYNQCAALVELFEKYGGKTAQQLKQDEQKRKQELRGAQSENNEHSSCIVCLGVSDNMIGIPCPEVHPDRICVGCYDSLLKFSNNCPLCRTALS